MRLVTLDDYEQVKALLESVGWDFRTADESRLRRMIDYADRTILKREVVPENVADAVFVLTGPELSRTTGLHIPVDSGVAAAFLR